MSQKTAEFFREKSEEEIMNWMVQNMRPEQIKSCFDIDGPDGPAIPEMVAVPDGTAKCVSLEDGTTQCTVVKESPLDMLRKFCANKRYVIHKIINKDGEDKVYFWYYNNEKWNYYNRPFSHFKEDKDGNILECGDVELVDAEMLPQLKKQYEEMNDEDFRKTQQEYHKLRINKEWLSVLLTAINIQKTVIVPDDYKDIFNFAPVLIDGTEGPKVYYYYLVNDQGDTKFKYTNTHIENFHSELFKILEYLRLKILQLGQDRTEGARRINEWVDTIKESVNNIDSDDLKTIKEIYTEFPLSRDSPFFMKDLFQGNEFGKYVNNSYDLSNYVLNKFGPNTANLYYAKEFTNNFGFKTINLVKK